mmetsp:Transcript_13245/g.28612  ORF Transcript_13245/g.28612 Transcript_13245/m.28612 type:complete len:205 (-) Transcript_13245:508-1122(-)
MRHMAVVLLRFLADHKLLSAPNNLQIRLKAADEGVDRQLGLVVSRLDIVLVRLGRSMVVVMVVVEDDDSARLEQAPARDGVDEHVGGHVRPVDVDRIERAQCCLAVQRVVEVGRRADKGPHLLGVLAPRDVGVKVDLRPAIGDKGVDVGGAHVGVDGRDARGGVSEHVVDEPARREPLVAPNLEQLAGRAHQLCEPLPPVVRIL